MNQNQHCRIGKTYNPDWLLEKKECETGLCDPQPVIGSPVEICKICNKQN